MSNTIKKIAAIILAMFMLLPLTCLPCYAVENSTVDISWDESVLINYTDFYTDAGADARGTYPGKFGSQFPRMLVTDDGTWYVAYTIYRNNGYLADANGGNELQISRSTNEGKTWEDIAIISDPGRDLDNAQMLELSNGDILLACRSVIWQQSYKLPVYKSSDGGYTWTYYSTIDEIHGAAGELGNPDRGVYEPFMVQINESTIGVMYASEKYATSTPTYSQILVLKTSTNNGLSWGEEIWTAYDTEHSNARPGMPVFAKMANGKFIMVFEIVGTTDVDVFYKISDDGINWPSGMGTQIPDQKGAPFVLSLSTGELLVTSNTHKISISSDYGSTWTTDDVAPFGSLFAEDDNLWPALYEVGAGEIVIVSSIGRAAAGYKNAGHTIRLRRGYINSNSIAVLDGCVVKLMSKHSGKYLDVSGGSMAENGNVQIWDENGALPEEWTFDLVDGNYYKITSANSGLALTAVSGSAGANVVQATWTGADTQKWSTVSVGNGYYKIVSKSNNLCLDVAAGLSEAGSNVQVWEDNGLDPQQWRLEIVSGIKTNVPYIVMAKHSGKVLDVDNGLLTGGANVHQWESNGENWQKWTLSMDSNGYYIVSNLNSNMSLDVDAGSILDGANVQQWENNGLNPQKWSIVNTQRGYFSFFARHSGKCLDVDAGKVENGANVQQWEYNGLDPQLWRIILA